MPQQGYTSLIHGLWSGFKEIEWQVSAVEGVENFHSSGIVVVSL